MKGTLHFLGSGGSLGVPMMGCSCEVCTSKDPKNNRLRPSVLINVAGKKLLVDCGPDVRQQFLRVGLDAIDGIILTHAHYDHIEGIDEMRALSIKTGSPTPMLMSTETEADLKKRFGYIFEYQRSNTVITTQMAIELFPSRRGSIEFCGIPISYFTYEQAGMFAQGLRFGSIAYVSDIKKYPESIFEDLKGVETLIVSALRFTDSMMHFTVDEALAFSKRVGAKKTWFTHICHDLEHEKTNRYLPENVRMAYDGLQLEFEL